MTEQGHRVGRMGGWDQEPKGKTSCGDGTKEERQGECRKTWRRERVKLRIMCWTALRFQWNEMWGQLLRLRLGIGVKMIYSRPCQWFTLWLSTEEDDTFSKLAFGNPQIKLSSDKDRITLLVPIIIKRYLPNSTTFHTVWGSKPSVLWLELWPARLKHHPWVAAFLVFHCNTHDRLSRPHGRQYGPPHCKAKKNPQEAGREFKCCRGCRWVRTTQIILKNTAFML